MNKGSLLGYAQEVHDVAKAINASGRYILNLSNEFACTSAVVHEYDGPPALYRSFDWPIKGFGDKLLILKREGKAGRFWDITYPGMVGTVQAMAPRRFAIAINRAPIPVTFKLPFAQGLTKPLDRWVQRIRTFRSDGAPAPFLLRKVFEDCASYDEAVEMLTKTKLASPTIFTICGTEAGQVCIIERDRDAAIVHQGDIDIKATANHWQNDTFGAAHPRPLESQKRLVDMNAAMGSAKGHFDWVRAPVLNDLTRMVCEMSPQKELIRIAGTEGTVQVTRRGFHRLP